MALATDYDCWHEEEVTVEMVRENLRENLASAQRLIKAALAGLPLETRTAAHSALAGAIFTDPAVIPEDVKKKYGILLQEVPCSRPPVALGLLDQVPPVKPGRAASGPPRCGGVISPKRFS